MMTIPMASPDLTDAEVNSVATVLRKGTLSLGPRIADFERCFAAYMGTPHAAGLSSGTAALHLAMIAAQVEENDLVVTTPFSFVASANCILYQRGVPVFVDVDPLTGNINPDLTSDAVSRLAGGSGTRRAEPLLRAVRKNRGSLKALLPVHAFGQPVDMDPLIDLSRTHGLALIEDA